MGEVRSQEDYGKVYVFNCYNESINILNVNERPADSITGWSTSVETKYTPNRIFVQRCNSIDQSGGKAAFLWDGNPVHIEWDTYPNKRADVVIAKDRVSIDDDLILYLTVNKAILMDTRGFVLGVFEIQ